MSKERLFEVMGYLNKSFKSRLNESQALQMIDPTALAAIKNSIKSYDIVPDGPNAKAMRIDFNDGSSATITQTLASGKRVHYDKNNYNDSSYFGRLYENGVFYHELWDLVLSTGKGLNEEKMKGEDPCWDDHEMVGMKKKDGKEVPNCVPKNEGAIPIDDPTKEEMLEFLKGKYHTEDDFDVESAIYWFANDYHGGQSSNLYSALSTSEFRPGPMHKGIEDEESEMATMMYQDLVDKYGGGAQEPELDNSMWRGMSMNEEDEEFESHGTYSVSNAGGYEIMLSPDGEQARVRDAFGSDNPETSDWLDIEWVSGKPVIDPYGYNIPLSQVIRR